MLDYNLDNNHKNFLFIKSDKNTILQNFDTFFPIFHPTNNDLKKSSLY